MSTIYTQSHLDALDEMIASGVLRTRIDGREVEYRSMADLRAARDTVARQIAAAAGQAPARHINPEFSRGT